VGGGRELRNAGWGGMQHQMPGSWGARIIDFRDRFGDCSWWRASRGMRFLSLLPTHDGGTGSDGRGREAVKGMM
jgi:hypothetical protein